MKRIDGRLTPAHRAAKRYPRGANLGNGLEVPPGQNWAQHYTPADLRHIRAEGFDHARIPAGWHHYTGPAPEFRIKPAFFARVDELVDAGLEQGLGVIINIHHFDDFTTDPKGQTPKFLAIWEQIAAHYAKAPEGLAFELLNEPKDAATTEAINPIFAEAIGRIRKTDPEPHDLRRAGEMEQRGGAGPAAAPRPRYEPDRHRAQLRAVLLHTPGGDVVGPGHKGHRHRLPRPAEDPARARSPP